MGKRAKKSQPIWVGTLSIGGSLKYEATSAARGNRAQLSKFTWPNQDTARAAPGDAPGLAGAVCIVVAVVVASRAQWGRYGWRGGRPPALWEEQRAAISAECEVALG